jgi:hypothetical protein
LLIALGAVLVGAYVVVMKLGFGEDYPLGFPTITLLIALLGGMQLVAIGILGEYVGRIYAEVKGRPPYIVDRFFNPPAVQPALADLDNRAATAMGSATPRQ